MHGASTDLEQGKTTVREALHSFIQVFGDYMTSHLICFTTDVYARESIQEFTNIDGLPTIVGVSGGLMKRLKTGMRVHIDAGKGKLTILEQQEEKQQEQQQQQEEKEEKEEEKEEEH